MAKDFRETLEQQKKDPAFRQEWEALEPDRKAAFASMSKLGESGVAYWVFDPDAIDWGLGGWKCSHCGGVNKNLPTEEPNIIPLAWAGSRYCPHCGYAMSMKEKGDK